MDSPSPQSGNANHLQAVSAVQESEGTWRSNVDRWSSLVQIPAQNRPLIYIEESYNVLVQFELPKTAGLQFKTPFIPLRVSDADGDGVFVATDSFSTVFGEGTSPHAAIRDYLTVLVDRFRDLERHEPVLAPGLRRDLATLRRYIARKR